MNRRYASACLGLLTLLSAAAGAAVAQTGRVPCDAVAQAQQSFNAGNLDTLRQQWAAAIRDQTCHQDDRAQITFNLGVLLARRAMAAPEAEREAGLLEASRIGGEPYPVEYLLGDLYAARQDWVQAAPRYNNVVRHIEQGGRLVGELTPVEADTLLRKWQTALMMLMIHRNSDSAAVREAAQAPRGRDGTPGKAMAGVLRDNTVARSSIPVNFVWNSVEFIPGAERYVIALAESLQSAGAKAVLLVGNADVTGQGSDGERDRFNCNLSRDRVKRVEAVLRQHGYTGSVELVAMGHRLPFQPPFPRDTFPQDMLNGMDRRVEASLTLSRKDYPHACD